MTEPIIAGELELSTSQAPSRTNQDTSLFSIGLQLKGAILN